MLRNILKKYHNAFSGLPREVWLLAMVLFINRSGSMVLAFLTLYATQQLGMETNEAGWLISVFGIGSLAGSYLGGKYCERFGTIRLQTVCLFLSVPAYLILPLWTSWFSLAISLFFLSVLTNAVRPANATAIAKLTTGENRTRAFALQRIAANFGFSFGPAIGGRLAGINYNLLFIVDAGTTFLAGIALLYFFRFQRVGTELDDKRNQTIKTSPLNDKPYVLYLTLMFISGLVFFQFMSTYPLYLKEHFKLEEAQIGNMFAVNTLVIVVFEMVLIDSIKRFSLLPVIGFGNFLICLGFGMMPLGATSFYCVIAMLVLTLGEMLSMPQAMGFVVSRSQAENVGPYVAWFSLTNSLAFIIGPAIGTVLYAWDQDILWYACLMLGVVVLIAFLLLARFIRDKPKGLAENSGDCKDDF